MKNNRIITHGFRLLTRILPTLTSVSCATFDHPLARHDMDGDGAISHPEYQQNHMQYNLARRQRMDEYDRARQVYRHVDNAGDVIGGARRAVQLLSAFGR